MLRVFESFNLWGTFDWIPLTWRGEATGGTSRVSYIHCRTNQNANPQHVWHPRNSSSHHSAATWTASFFQAHGVSLENAHRHFHWDGHRPTKKNYRLTTATFSPWQVAAGYSGALSSSQVDVGLCFLSGHCELHPLNIPEQWWHRPGRMCCAMRKDLFGCIIPVMQDKNR